MLPREKFLEDQKNNLLKAINHLVYSYNKVIKLPTQPSQLKEKI